jgi:hypothetical protein
MQTTHSITTRNDDYLCASFFLYYVCLDIYAHVYSTDILHKWIHMYTSVYMYHFLLIFSFKRLYSKKIKA